MNSDQIKICSVLEPILLSNGWNSILDSPNYYEKNGCVLILFTNGAQSEVLETSNGTIGGITILRTVRSTSWQLEYNGVIIDAGRLPGTICTYGDESYGADSKASEDLQKFLTKLESSVAQKDYQRISNAMEQSIVYVEKEGRHVTECEGFVMDDVHQNYIFTPKNDMPPFLRDGVYAFTGQKVLSDGTEVLSFMKFKNDLSDFVSTPVFWPMQDMNTFANACKSRFLIPLSIDDGVAKVPRLNFNPSGKNYIGSDLLDDISTSLVRKKCICDLMNECANFTNLLFDCPTASLNKLCELSRVAGFVPGLDKVELSNEVLTELITAACAGFDVETLIGKSAEEIHSYVAMKLQFFGDLRDTLVQQNVSTSVMSALPFYVGKISFSSLSNIESVEQLVLEHNEREHFMSLVSRTLLQYGVLSDGLLKVNINNVRNSDKAEIFTYLKAPFDFPFGDVSWQTHVKNVLRGSCSVCFHAKCGYLLFANNRYIGRDKNSIVIYDTRLTPVWRNVFIDYTDKTGSRKSRCFCSDGKSFERSV